MKNRMTNILLIACTILVQRLLFQTMNFELYQIPFASSLMIFQSQTGNLLQILYAFIPIPFILFEFSGRGRELTEGYGKLWVIRAYKRERLCLNTIKKCGLELLIIVLYQTVVFSLADEKWHDISISQTVLTLLTYYLGLFMIVLLQLYLEFVVETSYANIFSNIFFLVSLFVGNRVLISDRLSWIGIILFPNMLFGTRNGILYQETVYVKYEYAFIYLLAVAFVLCFLMVLKFRKKDVF